MSFKLTFNGRPLKEADFMRELEQAALEVVKKSLPAHIAESMSDDETGEKPSVSLVGSINQMSDLDGAAVKIEGSAELVAKISNQLGATKNAPDA